MRRDEATIVSPCRADWNAMTPVEARRRLCAECNKVVHDLSAMTDDDARRALRTGPICVRYLHDVHGNIIHGDVGNAEIVPVSSLTAKRRWLGAVAVAASAAVTALVFEACGGTAGGFDEPEPDADVDAGADNPDGSAPDAKPPHVYPDAGVDAAGDAGADAGADAGVPDASP